MPTYIIKFGYMMAMIVMNFYNSAMPSKLKMSIVTNNYLDLIKLFTFNRCHILVYMYIPYLFSPSNGLERGAFSLPG